MYRLLFMLFGFAVPFVVGVWLMLVLSSAWPLLLIFLLIGFICLLARW